MKKTTLFKDIEIAYYLDGSGPVLVLIHGFCEDSSMWNDVLEPLTAHFQILRIDLPGYGNSTIGTEHLSIVNFAELTNAVLCAEEIEHAVMLGHSLGGYVSVHFAELYPKKLKGFGFINSHVYADDADKKLNRDKSIQFITKNTARLFIRELINNLFSETYKKQYPEVLKSLINNAQHTISDHAIINTLVAMRDRESKAHVLQDSEVPVLFIIGEDDATITLETSCNQTYLANISQVHIRAGIAHMSVFEDSKYTADAIHSFVNFCYY